MEIRNAVTTDIPELIELLKYNVEFHTKFSNYSYSLADVDNTYFREEFEKYLNSSSEKLIVAVEKGKLIGSILGILRESEGCNEGIISQLFVYENYRKRGIATKLFEKLQKWFDDKKVKLLSVDIVAGNEGALDFYKKLGFEVNRLRLTKK